MYSWLVTGMFGFKWWLSAGDQHRSPRSVLEIDPISGIPGNYFLSTENNNLITCFIFEASRININI